MLRNQLNSDNHLTAIDLFAGGGGLTVGLKQAGFKVVSAVEIEPHAYSTYKANHPEVHAYKQDIRTIDGQSLKKLSPSGEIDLIAGCPPCQGFSSLTAKYRRDDPRNELVHEMKRLIYEIQPKAVMMENVPGLALKGKDILEEFVNSLKELGYFVEWKVLQVADYGVPQNRRRLVLLAGKGFKIDFPEPTHSRKGSNGKQQWVNLRNVIGDMPEPITMSEALSSGGPKSYNWHVVRNLSPQNIRRLKNAIPGKSWIKIPKRLRPDCHKDKNTGFSNVYGRLDWDQPSVTITGGCTTLSKGRFGHPEQLRTISVREAALIQTFPRDYIIDTDFMEHACTIIGNALPCKFAEVMSKSCYEALLKNK